MSFPRYAELELPLLRLIYELGGPNSQIRSSDAYAPLAASFGLDENDLAQTRNDLSGDGNSTPIWNNRVQWARNSLKKRGLLADSPLGYWRLSEAGIAAASRYLPIALRHVAFPDDLPEATVEGARKRVFVNAYDCSALARQACIEHYGYKCVVCDFDFEGTYGLRGRKFIHVHHVVPIASIGVTYTVDPVMDLRPICPNCHAMIHRSSPPCSIDELVEILRRPGSGR